MCYTIRLTVCMFLTYVHMFVGLVIVVLFVHYIINGLHLLLPLSTIPDRKKKPSISFYYMVNYLGRYVFIEVDS